MSLSRERRVFKKVKKYERRGKRKILCFVTTDELRGWNSSGEKYEPGQVAEGGRDSLASLSSRDISRQSLILFPVLFSFLSNYTSTRKT